MKTSKIIQLLLATASAEFGVPEESTELELTNPSQSSTWQEAADKEPFYAEHPFLHTLGFYLEDWEYYYSEPADWTTLRPTPCSMTTGHDEMPYAWWHADLKDP